MSGDVQPRKRKDKKKKKDELSIEEPRGTAAALGEGDVFLHSHHDHGTGGHWCAKVIFFSLLTILITLIGLIILENRGLSELEANSVESRYSGVLEGWLEDAPDDDHHDIHTLELKHHDDDDDHDEEDHDNHDDDDHEVEDKVHADEDSAEQDLIDEDDDEDEDEQEVLSTYNNDDENEADDSDEDENDDDDNYKYYDDDDENNQNDNGDNQDGDNDSKDQDDDDINDHENYNNENYPDDDDTYDQDNYNNKNYDDDEDDDMNNPDNHSNENYQGDDDPNDQGNENYQNDDNNGINDQHNTDNNEQLYEDNHELEDAYDRQDNEDKASLENNEDDDDHDNDDDDDHEDVELEKLEQEPDDEEPISTELPVLPETDDDDDDDDKQTGQDVSDEDQSPDDDEFLEQDDIDNDLPSVVERITVPSGKPLQEVDDDESSEQPVDTLADEDEYQRQQEELRKKEEEASHLWLKLGVGAALLLATHAVVRRAAASRDETADNEDESVTEETPTPERRMTLIPETAAPAVKQLAKEPPQKKIQEIAKQIPSIIKSAPTPQQRSLEEDEPEEEIDDDIEITPDKELHSDAEELEEEEGEEIIPKNETPQQTASSEKKADSEGEDDDVEIIEEEELEEGDEDVEEEEISDVDDAELLNRLEAKYGRLPEPERPGQKHKDGGNSHEEAWPGEPSDSYWRRQLDSAERELRQGSWLAAADRAASPKLSGSARARWIVAKAYDEMAEAKRDNKLLGIAISSYLELLKMNERMSNKKLLEITNRTLNRIQFRGNYLNAEPVYKLLIRRFPDNPVYRNNLTISFLMANRADLAVDVLKETIKLWPNDQIALAHYAFVLKTHFNRLEEAVDLFQKALEGDSGPANEPRFYYHLGDSLLLLGRFAEAHDVHKRAAALGHFLSPAQRSLYNVDRLKSRPWWNIEDTPYVRLARALEKSWKEISKEGEAARASFAEEKEGLRERGEWSQLDLFVRGREVPDRCKKAPVTCAIVKAEPAAAGCRRGQIKFSSMEPGTHVRPHVGPTNCRLRFHLALSNTESTYMRVDKEIRQWQLGKAWLFDDSFEHEVWHNGTDTRLVLIVDVWHPDLTPSERRTLPAI